MHGPWQIEPLATTVRLPDGSSHETNGQLPPPAKIILPNDWGKSLGHSFRGRVNFLRSFGCPSGLTNERILLCVEKVDAWATVHLNGAQLGKASLLTGPVSFEVTKLLTSRNQLRIEVELPEVNDASAPLPRSGRDDQPGGILGEVRLELLSV